MDVNFQGRRALVTGGGRGIGREIAESLARCGAKTFVFTKSDRSLKNMRLENPDIQALQVDLTDRETTRKAVESILPVDLLVNNAGIFPMAAFIEVTESSIDDAFNLHYKAPFNVSQAVARDLISRKVSGSIVNISSSTSIKHYPNLSVYGSSKAALDSLTKYMAMELGRYQIRVNAVNPTLVPTDMTKAIFDDPVQKKNFEDSVPLRRLGERREVADVTLFLLSDRASLVNGVTLPVDGGITL